MESEPQSQETSALVLSQDMDHPNKTLPLSKMATELNTVAESSNWTLVNDLLSVDGVCRCDVEQCCLLHKLAAAPEVSLSLARDILTKILKHKVDINMVDTNGDTAVVVAARCDNTKMVMELLSRQAALPPDVTHVCSFLQTLTNNWKPQETPYMHALVVKLLWDRLQDTALHSCHKQLHHTLVRLAVTFHTSLVREMFVTEQQVNSLDSEGMAVLHRVAMFDSDEHVRLLHYFISKGANVNLQNTSGDTPLHVAAKKSNWMMMEALLHRQAYCDLVNCEQRSVLHIVASYTNLEDCSNINKILPLLSRNNNDINKKDGEGNTALHLAALTGNLSLMTTLLGRGARADGVNNEQKTVLHMMAMTKRELFSKINSCINVLVLTVKRGADIQQKNCDGNSALHLAAKHGNWGLVEFLLKYVDDAAQLDSEGFNILHRVAMVISSQGRTLFYKVAQKVGDINAKSKTGDTAIQLAAKCQNWDMVKLLEQEGAAWDKLDSEGFHIVHRYAMGKNVEHNMLSFLDISMYCNTRCWTGDTVLHLAARHSNWSMVELIVDYVDNIDKVDSEGFTVIQRLVMSATNTFSSEYSLFCRLIELGADYTIRDENGDAVLHLAARNGHWEIVKHLAKLGAEADTPDSEGFSILHRIAAEEKRSYSVTAKELSQCGAIIKQKDLQGNTPLHLAVQHKNWKVAEELVKCGADVNDVDAEGLTVLHMLGQIHNYDHSCLSLIEFLLEKGARCDIESNGGETVWKIVVENENWSMMECLLASSTLVFKEHKDKYLLHTLVCSHQGDNHIQVCDLIQKRLPVNAKDRDGNSLLHLAAGAGNWWLVKLLIQKGARENMLDSKGLSILHRFVIGADRRMNRYTDILDTIIASSVDLNALDPRGNTALQIAAKRRLMGIVDRLIDSTENPNTKDDEGFTLLLRVSQTPSPECLSICQRLVQKGADINICSPDGESALHLAVKNNNWPVVELLMNSGARFEVEILEGLYPVHNLIKHSTFSEDSQLKLMTFLTYSEHSTSSEDNQLKLLTLLRDSGLSVSTPDSRGMTPTELAFTLKKWKLFIYLLESGAHLNPPLRKGNSYFHEFARNTSACSNMIDITRLLLSRGFDINLRNDDGDTPVHVAADKGNWDTIKTFVEHGASTSIPDSKGYYLLHKLLNKQTQNIAIYTYHSKTSTYESLEQLLIRTLVTHGEDVNRRGPDNKTALQIAAGNDEWEIVGKLISLGAVYELNQNEKLSALKHLDRCHWEDVTREQLHLFIKYIANDGSAINNSFQEEYGYGDPKTVLQKCVEQANWKMAIALVECGADVSNMLIDEALLELMMSRYSQENHATWMCFLDLLISRGLDINTKLVYRSGVLFSNDVCESLGESEENATSCLFSALLERGADPLLVEISGQTLLRKVVEFGGQRTLNALKKLLPAGVTTHQPRLTDAILLSQRSFLEQPVSPTERAVQKRHISAVKLLIQSGASSNSELFRLNTEYQVKMAVLADTNNDVRELLEVLSKAASEPHSLQSLCRLSVSHWLGCGPGRADKLKSLKIPSSLKNLISFCDLLSTEFVFHKHEDLSSSFSEEDDDHLYSDYNDSDRSIDYSVGEDSLPFHSNLDYYFE